MKAECIAQYKQLEGILDKGDIVEIETVRTTKDKVLSWKFIENPSGTEIHRGKKGNILPDVIEPAGTYKDYHFKSKNGEWYSGSCISGFIGPKPMDEIFKKL